MADKEYSGWKNRQTWNCALWIGNDEPMYRSAVAFMERYKGKAPYSAFIKDIGYTNERTPDNIKWFSNILDYKALNEMMRELVP